MAFTSSVKVLLVIVGGRSGDARAVASRLALVCAGKFVFETRHLGRGTIPGPTVTLLQASDQVIAMTVGQADIVLAEPGPSRLQARAQPFPSVLDDVHIHQRCLRLP